MWPKKGTIPSDPHFGTQQHAEAAVCVLMTLSFRLFESLADFIFFILESLDLGI